MASSSNILLHPLVCIVCEASLFIFTAGFTSPTSVLRPFVFLLIAGWTGLSTSQCRSYIDSTGFASRVPGGVMFSIVLSFLGRMLIQRRCLEQEQQQDAAGELETSGPSRALRSPSSAATRPASFSQRLAFGVEVATNSHGQVVPWDKYVPPFSRSGSKYVPSFSELLFKKATSLLFCLLVHDYAVDIFLLGNANKASVSRIDAIAPWLVSLQDSSLIKLRSTIAYWVVQYAMLEIQHCLSTVVDVLKDPKDLERRRPLFGSVLDAYTVRRFWGTFWHQRLRDFLSVPSRFITHSVLGLPKQTFLARYTFIFWCFFLSGAMHVAADVAGPLPELRSALGALFFFCSQPLGIMVEDLVLDLYGKQRPVNGKAKDSKHDFRISSWSSAFGTVALRTMGFIWTIAFLSYTTPLWVYPVADATRREDALMQRGAFAPLISWFRRPQI